MSPGTPSRSLGGDPETLGDQDLIESVLAGEIDLYAVVVRRYQGPLYRYALGMVMDPDAAADLVQNALVKAFANLKRCRQPSRLRSWLFQILRNGALDYLKESRRRDVPLDVHSDSHAIVSRPESDMDRWELRDVLDQALAKLPEAQREAFILKHVHDLSYEEMADIVGASVSALRMRVLRAREQLQAFINAQVRAGETKM